jgi:predicted amidohydrolase
MKDVRVALAQIAVEPLDPKKNIDRMLRVCDGVGSGADRIVTATLRAQTIAEERAWRPIFADRRPEVYRLDEAEGKR